jgi:hypothetical protein
MLLLHGTCELAVIPCDKMMKLPFGALGPSLTLPVKPDEVHNACALLRLIPLKLGTVQRALPNVTDFVTLTGPVG